MRRGWPRSTRPGPIQRPIGFDAQCDQWPSNSGDTAKKCGFSSAAPGNETTASIPTDALLTDGHMRQSLAAARALGRSGLKVAVAEAVDACDMRLRVPAFSSRWASWHTTLPEFRQNPDGYAQAILDVVHQHPTRLLIPSSDGSVAALRPWRTQLEREGVVLALASESALEVANDKQRTLEVAGMLGVHGPRTLPALDPEDVPNVLQEIGYPAVIKPTHSWVRHHGTGTQVRSQEVLDEKEGLLFAERLSELGSAAIVQEWVGGSRESVSLLYADGKIWAEFAQVAHRMAPVLGGVSVVRESIPMPPDLRSAAVALVRALDLEGYSEIEFRRDARGHPLLMEINARLSGSIEVAIRSGVDFPGLLWRWALGEKLIANGDYRTGVRMRWLHGDLKWLKENLFEGGRPDSVPTMRAAIMFVREFFSGAIYDDLDFDDVRPSLIALASDIGKVRRQFSDWVKRGYADSSRVQRRAGDVGY